MYNDLAVLSPVAPEMAIFWILKYQKGDLTKELFIKGL